VSSIKGSVALGRARTGALTMAVLVRFREYGLKLKPKKCELFQKEVEFLGRVVGPRGKHSPLVFLSTLICTFPC
jgi:hypothetical protein